jgi:hypothetical protein
MPPSHVLQLNNVLFVPRLKINLLSSFCMEKLQYRVAFEGQRFTISDCCLAILWTVARGVLDGGLYKLLVDPVVLVHSTRKLDEPSSLEEVYGKHVWWDAMELCSQPIVELVMDFKHAVDGSSEEDNDKVVGFSWAEGVDLHVTLVLGFSPKEGGDLVEVDVLVARGFEVHGRDTHDYRVLTILIHDDDLRDNGVR